jgi:predicted NAD/FAD-binding protein
MLRDIFRFNAQAVEEAKRNHGLTIGEFLDHLRMGRWFREYYLLPFSGAIWSTPKEQIMDFPAYSMVQFFENHALLGYEGQHQWYTVKGGSTQYVQRIEREMHDQGVNIRLGCPVDSVRRTQDGPMVKVKGADWEGFDDVIFATHSDVTLSILEDPSDVEAKSLGAVGYQANDVVLHADESIMPKSRAVWSSWNYAEGKAQRDGQIDITYWMNSLQPIPKGDPHFVTLNSRRPIREDLIYDQVTLHHPVYDLAALDAQKVLRAANGTRNTWFCGAWMRHGFHEDGLASGLEVADSILAPGSVPVAAE